MFSKKRILPILLLFCFLLPMQPASAAVSMPGEVGNLNPAGAAYEINADSQGKLWISDFGANEIWRVDPKTWNYTAFQNIPSPSDARIDAAGNLWWADYENKRLGELPFGAQSALTWSLPGAVNAYGTFVDATGKVWVSDNTSPNIYQFDPSSHNLCAYSFSGSLPNARFSYLTGSKDTLWVADVNNARLYQIPLTTRVPIIYWSLDSNSYPQSLLAMADDSVAWTDLSLQAIARFDPHTGNVTTYPLPVAGGQNPKYLTQAGSEFWFTQDPQLQPGFGRFNPSIATGSVTSLTATTPTIQPGCNNAGAGTPLSITQVNGTIAHSGSNFDSTLDTAAWSLFSFGLASSTPEGIAYAQGSLWMVNSTEKTLFSVPVRKLVYLPVAIRP